MDSEQFAEQMTASLRWGLLVMSTKSVPPIVVFLLIVRMTSLNAQHKAHQLAEITCFWQF